MSNTIFVKYLLDKEQIAQKVLAQKLCEKVGKVTSPNNFAMKLKNGNLRLQEAIDICDILGYKIIVEKKKG